MKKESLPKDEITPEEALKLFEHTKIADLYRAMKLHDAYREKNGTHEDALWDKMNLLAFMFMTGRIQGMREERNRKAERK